MEDTFGKVKSFVDSLENEGLVTEEQALLLDSNEPVFGGSGTTNSGCTNFTGCGGSSNSSGCSNWFGC